jgi:antidote-toxin recognition MazE-like antitoxin
MTRRSPRPIAQMRAKAPDRKAKRSSAKTARPKSSREKVRAYRQRMRAKGMRLVQMWLPDNRTPEFVAEARRQSLLASTSPYAAEDHAWVASISDWNSN